MSKHIEEELLEILESAITAEKAAQERYRLAGKIAVRSESKSLFHELEEEEKVHEKKLYEKFIEIKKALGLKIVHKIQED